MSHHGRSKGIDFAARVRRVSVGVWTFDIVHKLGEIPEERSVGEHHSRRAAEIAGRRAAIDAHERYAARQAGAQETSRRGLIAQRRGSRADPQQEA